MSHKQVANTLFRAVLLLLLAPLAYAAPQASLEASRVSGPAPLAVHFDATGTTDSNSSIDAFRQLGYLFSFDDPSSGVWRVSGKSKNEQRGGPIAAHVFETPGTYRVTVRAEDASGQADTASVTITVTDPDQVYSGSNTVVISRTSDTSGAPAGARVIANASSWPEFESNKRYLLRAGQDFSSLGSIGLSQIQDWQVGKFGDGADPVVDRVPIETGNPDSTGTNWAARGVVMDLDASRVYKGNSSDHILILRCSSDANVDNGGTVGWYANNASASVRDVMYWPTYGFLVDSEVSGSGSEPNAYQGWGRGQVVMGSTLYNPTQHIIRMWFAYKAFIGHNRLYNPGSTQQHIKLHSAGTGEYADNVREAASPASRYIVVADNVIGANSEVTPWAMTFAPQNGDSGTAEGVQDVIVENNVFHRNSFQDVGFGGRRMTERGNSLQGGSSHSVGTSVFAGGVPGGWDGPYYVGEQVVVPPGQTASPPVTPSLTIQ